MEDIDLKSAELAALCRKYRVKRLEIFGSTARGTAVPGKSDLDFLVEFIDTGWQGSFDRYMGLLMDLETLFSVKVDLVKSQAIDNVYFQQTVDEDRQLIYAA